MMAADGTENVTFAQTRADVVTKPDGRYLIYYAWPGLDDDDVDAGQDAQEQRGQGPRGPDQQPWSPQGGPPDE